MNIKKVMQNVGMTVAAGIFAVSTGCVKEANGSYEMTLPGNVSGKDPMECYIVNSEGKTVFLGKDRDKDGKTDEFFMTVDDIAGNPCTRHFMLTRSSSLKKKYGREAEEFYEVGGNPLVKIVLPAEMDCNYAVGKNVRQGLELIMQTVDTTPAPEYLRCVIGEGCQAVRPYK